MEATPRDLGVISRRGMHGRNKGDERGRAASVPFPRTHLPSGLTAPRSWGVGGGDIVGGA